jgi:hypothetical protein
MDNEIREVLPIARRIDTGALRFGNDWPGVFIRGDEALEYAKWLRKLVVVEEFPDGLYAGLARLLESCRVDKKDI